MKRLGLLLALVLVPSRGFALYGGDVAQASEGDAAVSFEWREGPRGGSCSGMLIHRRAVLTAAHCVAARGGRLHRVARVRIGNPAGRTTTVTVTRVVAHPDFDVTHPEHGNDLAVLVLSRDVTERTPARLATTAEEPHDQGTPLRIAGFGLMRRGNRLVPARALRAASLELLSPFHCFSGDVEGMATTRLCAASPSAGVCPGDSGSAATIQIDGATVVVGVVSLAIDQSTCQETATVLMRVTAFEAFLRDAMAAP